MMGNGLEVEQTEGLGIDNVESMEGKERAHLSTGAQLKLQDPATHSR
jgi:hypothetical protein